MGYLTPDTIPAGNTCRVLFIPDNEEFIAVVTGALFSLTLPNMWEKYGLLTPEQSAAALVPMFNDFCFQRGICRMIGEIFPFGGTSSPDARLLICDGSSLLRAAYPELFAIIGTNFGAVDGSHFNLPDMRGRTVVGAGTGSGLSPRAVGDSLGEEGHTLTVGEMPSHAHTTGNSLSSLAVMPGEGPVLTPNPLPAYTGNTGGDGAHNNMQPSLVLTYLIVASL